MSFASSTDMELHPSVIRFPEGERLSGQLKSTSSGSRVIDGSVPEKAWDHLAAKRAGCLESLDKLPWQLRSIYGIVQGK